MEMVYPIHTNQIVHVSMSHWEHWWRRLQPDAKSVDSNLCNFAMQGWRQLNRGANVIIYLSRRHPCCFFKGSYLVIYKTLALIFPVQLIECSELYLWKNPRRNMHVYPAKSSRFESTDFASIMIDDIGCSRLHQCPQCACDTNGDGIMIHDK